MDAKTRSARGITVALVVGLLAACDVGSDPTNVPPEESIQAEMVLDQAAETLASQSGEMAADAEREADRERKRDAAREGRRHVDRARLAVELGGTAVSLATRILAEQGADEAQLRLLESAVRFQERAETALADGDASRAVALARRACWTALKSVVLPGGVTEEEARFVYDLAQGLLGAARSEVGAGNSAVEEVLLRWAERFFAAGAAQLESGDIRGLVALWKSAVVSTWILG